MIRPIARTGSDNIARAFGARVSSTGIFADIAEEHFPVGHAERFESRRFTRICREDKKPRREDRRIHRTRRRIYESLGPYTEPAISQQRIENEGFAGVCVLGGCSCASHAFAHFSEAKNAVKAYGAMRKVARSEKIETKRISEA